MQSGRSLFGRGIDSPSIDDSRFDESPPVRDLAPDVQQIRARGSRLTIGGKFSFTEAAIFTSHLANVKRLGHVSGATDCREMRRASCHERIRRGVNSKLLPPAIPARGRKGESRSQTLEYVPANVECSLMPSRGQRSRGSPYTRAIVDAASNRSLNALLRPPSECERECQAIRRFEAYEAAPCSVNSLIYNYVAASGGSTDQQG